jgi:dihydrofolate reductase
MKALELVVAADEARGIGKEGKLPWRLPQEMAYFKRLTSEARPGRENALLMGRNTYESIAPKFRPLVGRRNIVLSRDATYAPAGTVVARSLEEAVSTADDELVDRLFVIGGADLYRQALAHPACRRVYVTRLHTTFDCDTFLPPFEQDYELTWRDGPQPEADLSYSYELWERL